MIELDALGDYFATSGPDAMTGKKLDAVLDQLSPLTLAVLDLVANAVADLDPEQQGYVIAYVGEQILEFVAFSLASEGAARQAEAVGVMARLKKVLGTSEIFAQCKTASNHRGLGRVEVRRTHGDGNRGGENGGENGGGKGRVAPGDCSPGAPTDPYVQNYRIRFLK